MEDMNGNGKDPGNKEKKEEIKEDKEETKAITIYIQGEKVMFAIGNNVSIRDLDRMVFNFMLSFGAMREAQIERNKPQIIIPSGIIKP